jgi:subtilisin family serine protease
MPRTGLSAGVSPRHPSRLLHALAAMALLAGALVPGSAGASALAAASTDHRVSTHLAAALQWAAAGERSGQLDPLGRRAEPATPALAYDWATPTEEVLLVIEGDVAAAALEAAGARVNTRAGTVTTAVVALDRVPALLALPGLRSVEMEQPITLATDVSAQSINAEELWGGPPPVFSTTGETGRGVVVGIVDTGLDTNHEDFRTDHGTRVRFLWDQTIVGGDPPAGFTYGKAYDAADIDAGRYSGYDENGHGTHVAGIAAGNGRATGNGQPAYTYPGIAPEADIVIVKLKANPNGSYTDARLIDGVNYVFQRAAQLGQPAVVLLASTKFTGPHDGSDPLDLALTALTGPGKLLVTAAGNEYGKSRHAEWTSIQLEATGSITVNVPAYTPSGNASDHFFLEAWYPANGHQDVTLVSPSGWTLGPIRRGEQANVQGPNGIVVLKNGVTTSASGAYKVELQVYRGNLTLPQVASGTWTVRFVAQTSAMHRVDAWLTSWSLGSASATFGQGKTESRLIGSPGTADGAICVTAFTTKRTWTDINGTTRSYFYAVMNQIANYASSGPRRDGLPLPHIAAPGYGVAGALSSLNQVSTSYKLKDGVHFIANGTSVAAAHVAGGIALLLQQQPELTREMALNLIESAAIEDSYTGAVPNDRWGAGKLYLQPLGAAGVADGQAWAAKLRFAAWPNPSRGPAVFRFDVPAQASGQPARAEFQIIDVAGREVTRLHRDFPAGPAEWTWDGTTRGGTPTAPGIYWARLTLAGGTAVTRVVRLP